MPTYAMECVYSMEGSLEECLLIYCDDDGNKAIYNESELDYVRQNADNADKRAQYQTLYDELQSLKS